MQVVSWTGGRETVAIGTGFHSQISGLGKAVDLFGSLEARKLFLWGPMSDDPPPLRLKPRVRPPEGSAADPPPPAPLPTPPAAPQAPMAPPLAAAPAVPEPQAAHGAGESPLKLRVKPRLTAEVAAAPTVQSRPPVPEAPVVAAPTPVPEPPSAVAPMSPAPTPVEAPVDAPVPPPAVPPGGDASEAPKFKLKTKPPVGAAVAAPPPAGLRAAHQPPSAAALSAPPPPSEAASDSRAGEAAPPGAAESGEEMPPFPVVAPPRSSHTTPPIHIRVPTSVTDPALAAPPPHALRRKSRATRRLALLATGAVVAAGGLFAYLKLTAPPPPPPIKIAPVQKRPLAAPTAKSAADLIGKVAAAPGSLIQKGQNAIAAHRENAQAQVDEVAGGSDAANKSAAPSTTAAAAPPATHAVSESTTIAPGVTATTTDIEAASTASPEFQKFVASAAIGGVFQGTPPRALINGRVLRAGQTADATLGIVFDSIDASRKVIVFKDATGAIVQKHY